MFHHQGVWPHLKCNSAFLCKLIAADQLTESKKKTKLKSLPLEATQPQKDSNIFRNKMIFPKSTQTNKIKISFVEQDIL